ncbi:membrane protein [Anopheles sinensis]|uniref:Membrane protein n=1 Tax=Anopheles sinensis TaxID=74873 RepID=A0A084W2A9_ANOSI|nr:membrane protein [Anopheles sinensis]
MGRNRRLKTNAVTGGGVIRIIVITGTIIRYLFFTGAGHFADSRVQTQRRALDKPQPVVDMLNPRALGYHF